MIQYRPNPILRFTPQLTTFARSETRKRGYPSLFDFSQHERLQTQRAATRAATPVRSAPEAVLIDGNGGECVNPSETGRAVWGGTTPWSRHI
jgi:hypothetical protein